MKPTFQPLPIIIAALLTTALPGLAQADNMPCSEVMKQVSEWEAGSSVYNLTLIKSMAPDIKDQISRAKTNRKIPKGAIKRIKQVQIDFFVKECNQNAGLDTYTASRRALEQTRQLTLEYLEYRN
ncbi:MAG: hypothetical protein V7752_12980 [Halopseudomonas sp.]